MYEDHAIDEPGLTVPHPRMTGRAFVMTPLAEIAPEITVGGHRAKEIAGTLDRAGLTVRAEAGWDGVGESAQDVRL